MTVIGLVDTGRAGDGVADVLRLTRVVTDVAVHRYCRAVTLFIKVDSQERFSRTGSATPIMRSRVAVIAGFAFFNDTVAAGSRIRHERTCARK